MATRKSIPQNVQEAAQPYLDDYKEFNPKLKYFGRCLGFDAYNFGIDELDGDDVYLFLDCGDSVDVVTGFDAVCLMREELRNK